MQFSTLAVVFFATLAAARSHGHDHRFRYRRHFNESAPVDLTTLTVQITSTHTVFGCAQNVTSCPARDATATRTVTQVIDLTTTVCPVASASDVSSKVIASAAQNPTLVPPALTTDAAAAETGDSVLTYTLGVGSSKSVVTTTIKNTKTTTAHTTKYITVDGSAQATPIAGNQNNNNGNGNGNGNGSGNGEPTTTIRSTSTATRTVTIEPASSSPGTGSFIGVPNGEGSNGGDCAAPVTVTVALSTVTVTYTPPAVPVATVPSAPGSFLGGNNNAVKTTPVVGANTEAPAATAGPADADSAGLHEPEVVTSTNYVIPVPYANNTETATRRHSSGFVRSPKPTGTGSRIDPAPTGWY